MFSLRINKLTTVQPSNYNVDQITNYFTLKVFPTQSIFYSKMEYEM